MEYHHDHGVRLERPEPQLAWAAGTEIYGKATLADVEQSCLEVANELSGIWRSVKPTARSAR